MYSRKKKHIEIERYTVRGKNYATHINTVPNLIENKFQEMSFYVELILQVVYTIPVSELCNFFLQ